MSNFNFSWKWKEWEDDSIKLNKIFYNPKITFIRNLIRKELRLTSNIAEVEDSLPDEFIQYLDTSYVPTEEMLSFYQSLFTEHTVTVEEVSTNDLFFKLSSIPMDESVRTLLDYVHKQNEQRDVNDLKTIISDIKEQYLSLIHI